MLRCFLFDIGEEIDTSCWCTALRCSMFDKWEEIGWKYLCAFKVTLNQNQSTALCTNWQGMSVAAPIIYGYIFQTNDKINKDDV